MPRVVTNQFKGLYTNTDEYSCPGAVIAENVDIDLIGDVKKSLGYAMIGGTPVSGITDCLGAIDYNGEIIAMLTNGTAAKLYKTTPSLLNYSLIESTITWNASNTVRFAKYASSRANLNYLLFVNGESKTIGGNTGGVFVWDGSATGANVVALFGKTNNPTGKFIEVHEERVWIGDITAIGATSEANGRNWIMVSKLFPEVTDTSYTQASLGTITTTKGQQTKIAFASITPSNVFSVSDEVYITNVNGDIGNEYLNGLYHEIVAVDSSSITINTDTSGALDTISNITIALRGNNWSPSDVEFEGVLAGAGIFRCDNNTDDYIMALKSAFGVLTIFRKQSIYFFTGAIETGNIALARKMNLPYGAVSSNVLLTEGGIWFISQYGLSKVEGVTVKTVRTELDNITSITYTENIKPTFNDISDKSALVLTSRNTKIVMHDKSSNIDYILDVVNGEWVIHKDRLADYYVNINNIEYAVYNSYIFQVDSGYDIYDASTNAGTNELLFISALQYNSELDANRLDYYTTNNTYTINGRDISARYYNFQTVSGTNYLSRSTLDTSSVTCSKNVFSFWATGITNGTNKWYIFPQTRGFGIIQNGNKVVVTVQNSTSSSSQYSITNTDQTMKHYCVVYTNATGDVSMYENGVLLTPTATAFNVIADFTMSDTYIASAAGLGSSINSAITDFSIFNYTTLSGTLTDQQIATNLYSNTYKYGSIYKLVYEYAYLLTKAHISRYKLGVNSFEDNQNIKQLKELILLVEGTSTNEDVVLTTNLYYNGSSSVGKQLAFNIKQQATKTWAEITLNETLTWTQITSAETLTWAEILGGQSSILRRKAYDVGYCDSVQLEFLHNNNDDGFKLASMTLDVEQIIR